MIFEICIALRECSVSALVCDAISPTQTHTFVGRPIHDNQHRRQSATGLGSPRARFNVAAGVWIALSRTSAKFLCAIAAAYMRNATGG